MKLKVENLFYDIDNTNILSDINLQVEKGEFVGILGPNGSGKSTLLKNIYRVLNPTGGAVFLNEENVNLKTGRMIAKELAVVSQELDYGFEFSVKEMVLMGRYPLKSFYEKENDHDEKMVDYALKTVGMEGFKDRSFFTLSGGEKQRVLISRAIAQETDFIIMDEPTNHLDAGYQIKIMDLVRSLKKTVFTAIHDLNMAIVYCDRVIVLDNGKIVGEGKPKDVLTEKLLREMYGVDANIIYNEYLKRNIIVFKSKYE